MVFDKFFWKNVLIHFAISLAAKTYLSFTQSFMFLTQLDLLEKLPFAYVQTI